CDDWLELLRRTFGTAMANLNHRAILTLWNGTKVRAKWMGGAHFLRCVPGTGCSPANWSRERARRYITGHGSIGYRTSGTRKTRCRFRAWTTRPCRSRGLPELCRGRREPDP